MAASTPADPETIRLRETADGWWVASLPHTLRPDYDFQAACRGMTEEDIQREILMNWNATAGVRVWSQFRYEVHVASAPLAFDPEQPLYIGWDWGNEPACAITQLNTLGQWLIFPSFAPEANEFDGIYSFAERVANHLQREYAAPHDMELKDLQMVHVGDPAGRSPIAQAAGRKGGVTTCFDILRRGIEIFAGEDENGRPIVQRKPGWGWHVVPGVQTITGRIEAVRSRLMALIDGYPALLVDPREEFIISCMLGGYHYHQHNDGFINIREPKKDHACVDTATEAMTPSGWRRYDELAPGDPIYVYDMALQALRIGTTQRVHVHEGLVEVMHLHNQCVDMVVTPNHRCLARPKTGRKNDHDTHGAVEFVRADALNTGHRLFAHASLRHSGRPQEFFTDDFVRLCAWVSTEGTYHRDGVVHVCQSESYNPQYVAELDRLILSFKGCHRKSNEFGKPGLIKGREIPPSNMALWRIAQETAWLIQHWMPDKWPSYEMIQRMNLSQMRLFLYEAIRGDGSGWGRETEGPLPPPKIPIGRERDFFVRPGAVRLYQSTVRAEQFDRLQLMATLAGMDARIRVHDKADRLALSLARVARLGVAVQGLRRSFGTEDLVWCPETDAGTWVARRAGTVFVTGNSHICDCLGYIASRLFVRPEKREDEEDEMNFPKHEFRSQASGSRWR